MQQYKEVSSIKICLLKTDCVKWRGLAAHIFYDQLSATVCVHSSLQATLRPVNSHVSTHVCA